MVRSKASSKKQQQKKGIDFKKIKRKLGRKLPPPKNATNTEIKSKAIVLPEQSVATNKEGVAVSKKGLTLKELLQQTSHYNAKVRRDALMGIKDLAIKHPAELKLHRYAVIEKLRERISDDDKVVREGLYQLFKSEIFPGCAEDNQGPFISLVMTYIFNAMTNLAVDIRLMAFRFFDLVVQHYPPCFSLYAEKILQSYEGILRKSQFYLEDKGKLKSTLSGLVRCLSLLPIKKPECEEDVSGGRMIHAFEPDAPTKNAGFSVIVKKLKELVLVLINCFQDFIPLLNAMPQLDAQSFDCIQSILQSIDIAVRFFIYGDHEEASESKPFQGSWDQTLSSSLSKKLFGVFPLYPKHHLSVKEDDRYFILNAVITEIFLHLHEWISPSANVFEKFLEFLENALLGKACSSTRSGKATWEKHVPSLLPFIPKLISVVTTVWQSHLFEAFTQTFKDCNPESSLKLACLSTIEEMLISRGDMHCAEASDPVALDYQAIWIRELPLLLILLDNKRPSSSQVVLNLLLRLGRFACSNTSLLWEYENTQFALSEFFSTCQEGNINYGPFMRLPWDSQELSICCLYYFSNLSTLLLKSVASCCLCPELEPNVLFRIIEVLHAAYKAGHIQIADHISFFITLLSRFKVLPENICPVGESDVQISNYRTFKSLTSTVSSCLSQMGDCSVVFLIIEKAMLDLILLKPPLDNACAMLRVLIMLDSKPTRLSEQSIIALSSFIPGYLLDVVHHIPEDGDNEATVSNHVRTCRYYLLPCFFLFDRSNKLLKLVLNVINSSLAELAPQTSSQHATDSLSQMNAIVSLLLLMYRDVKVQKVMSLLRTEIDSIVQSIATLQSSEVNMTLEERHKFQCSFEQLKVVTTKDIFVKAEGIEINGKRHYKLLTVRAIYGNERGLIV
ncbi:Armadillo-like helical [Corchorus capsularis]|uniref:Armadillo-like helical n=1 Tax=Corchorus capsularis TaxID=210143 RepID=A0A1R3IJ19_COCAP|nr:Armadillo-like helical [Corchorus capsularis]